MKKLINKISYKVLESLSGCKWFYDSTIRDAIEYVLKQEPKPFTQEMKDQVYSKVKDALEIIKKERM